MNKNLLFFLCKERLCINKSSLGLSQEKSLATKEVMHFICVFFFFLVLVDDWKWKGKKVGWMLPYRQYGQKQVKLPLNI